MTVKCRKSRVQSATEMYELFLGLTCGAEGCFTDRSGDGEVIWWRKRGGQGRDRTVDLPIFSRSDPTPHEGNRARLTTASPVRRPRDEPPRGVPRGWPTSLFNERVKRIARLRRCAGRNISARI